MKLPPENPDWNLITLYESDRGFIRRRKPRNEAQWQEEHEGHRCRPPASNWFRLRFDVGAIWLCPCGRRWEAVEDRQFRNLFWVPISKRPA